MSDSHSHEGIESSPRIAILRNPVQEYAWGSTTAIQDLLGQPQSEEKPMAELWMGAHPKAPSEVRVHGEWKSLAEIIENRPEPVLGKDAAGKFSNKLPFLFKILAAASPLSIQVHPNLQQAREGFARENGLGVPLTAPDRNYKDENHKPEIICALTRFRALKGFRAIGNILGLMDKVSPPPLSNELAALRKRPDPHGLKRFFTSLLTIDKGEQDRIVGEAVTFAGRYATDDVAFRWMIELNGAYPGDIGVFSPLYLNVVELNPGEALYLPAGELHAYLGGVAVELMANSDNVLRCGLTPKHIDLSELAKIANFRTETVDKIKPVKRGACESAYPTPAEEFLLSVISVNQGMSFSSPRDRSVEILICTEGEADIKDLGTGELLSLTRGKSILVPATVNQYRIEGGATFYKASVPTQVLAGVRSVIRTSSVERPSCSD